MFEPFYICIFIHLDKRFCRKLASVDIINWDNFSVEPSKINDNLKNVLFHSSLKKTLWLISLQAEQNGVAYCTTYTFMG